MDQQYLSFNRDTAVELINEAKTAKDKVYVLEQVREILLNREPSLLEELLSEVMEFMAERNPELRRFLCKFAGEAFHANPTVLHVVINLFTFLISDTHDLTQKVIAHEMQKMYERAILLIAGMQTQPGKKSGGGGRAEPKQLYDNLRSITWRLVDIISSDRPESLRISCLALAENVVLFGMPAPPQSFDPRLKQKNNQQQQRGSVSDISLQHPFIDRNELEQEAEGIFVKMLMWTARGGPQGFPFTKETLSRVGQAIAGIATDRPRKIGGKGSEEPRGFPVAKVLTSMFTGKQNMCKDMSGSARSHLARATGRLLRSAMASMADAEGVVAKLRESLKQLEAMDSSSSAPAPTQLKRIAEDISQDAEGGAGVDEEDVQDAKRRAMAIEKLNAEEKAHKEKAAILKSSAASGGGGGGGAGGVGGIVQGDTELAADLAPVPEGATSARLTNLVVGAGSSMQSGIALTPNSQPPDVSGELAAAAMQRLLDSFYEVKSFNPKAVASHAKLCIRLALTMAMADLDGERQMSRVPIIAYLPTVGIGRLADGVPSEVQLPRSIWLLTSFILKEAREVDGVSKGTAAGQAEHHVKKVATSVLAAAVKEKLGLLMVLLVELHERSQALTSEFQQHQAQWKDMYDSVCLVSLSRFLQNLHLRVLAKPLVTNLPRLPSSCLCLLKLLMHTGTKAVAVVSLPGARGAKREEKNRGTRTEAMTLLVQLALDKDETVGAAAFNHLLWSAIAEDFDIRSKAVTLLINEVMTSDWAYKSGSIFALQAASSIVGQEAIFERGEMATVARRAKWGAAAEALAAISAAASSSSSSSSSSAMEVDETTAVADDGNAEAAAAAAAAAEEATAALAAEEEENSTKNLLYALEGFDGGAYFEGTFPPCPTTSRAEFEKYIKRMLHLLTQVCINDATLLGAIMDIAGVASAQMAALAPASSSSSAIGGGGGGGGDREVGGAEAAAGGAKKEEAGSVPMSVDEPVDEASQVFGPVQQAKLVLDTIRKELAQIIPAIILGYKQEDVFEYLARSDPMARSLLENMLAEKILADRSVPPTPSLITRVKQYIEVTRKVAEGAAVEEPVVEVASYSSETLRTMSESDLRLTCSILGGLPTAEVEECLPHLMSTFISAHPDVLDNAFSRIVSCRPPAMSKAKLLVYMHRIDYEAHAIDKKVIVDSIGLLLAREDYRSDVIKEALKELVQDEVISFSLMRTAILSQSKFVDVKRFLATETVPHLVRRRVWTLSSAKDSVWVGVCKAFQLLASNKDADQMLRCMLGLPGAQLKQLLKTAPASKAAFQKTLKILTPQERVEVLSGRWAKIDVSSKEGDALTLDSEKTKIIKEIESS